MLHCRITIGRTLHARTLTARKAEARAGCKTLNSMTALGMPVSKSVAGNAGKWRNSPRTRFVYQRHVDRHKVGEAISSLAITRRMTISPVRSNGQMKTGKKVSQPLDRRITANRAQRTICFPRHGGALGGRHDIRMS